MRILAIESSAAPASCCLWEDGRILARAGQNGGMTHSQTLLPMCEQLLRQTGLSVADMDYIAVAAGPGSFTGVRIAVATAWHLRIPSPASPSPRSRPWRG